MIKKTQIKNVSLDEKKILIRKVVKYASIVIGTVIIICLLIFIFFPDPFINGFIKDRITKSLIDTAPEYSIQLGDMHYSVWNNRLECDSITIKTIDSTYEYSASSISVGGISWMKVLWQRDFTLNHLNSSVIDAQNIVLNFCKSKNGLRFGTLHISIPDSEMTADSVKYYSLIDDEQFFAKSQFRQTRFRFDVPQIKILGLDYLGLLKGNNYNARSININDLFADILVNMDKPYDKNSTNPQMPNEALTSIKEMIKVDSLKIINGRLKYCERFAVRSIPGIVTFNKINVSVKGISNNATHPDTTEIRAEGLFMNSGKMNLFMAIPLASKDFSLRYSGSLSSMDVTQLNSFVEPSEHQRIKSGTLHSAEFNINVNSGQANGTLRVAYKDLSIAILNEETGSENGVFNRILSYFGKVFVIRENNMPDEQGLIKIGEIKYSRRNDDYFIQFIWFALCNGTAVVVGFPPI